MDENQKHADIFKSKLIDIIKNRKDKNQEEMTEQNGQSDRILLADRMLSLMESKVNDSDVPTIIFLEEDILQYLTKRFNLSFTDEMNKIRDAHETGN